MIQPKLLFACSILFIISCCLFSIHEDIHEMTTSQSAATFVIDAKERNATTLHNSSPNNTTEIIIQLSGQFGNHLSKIAAGIAVALELEARGRHTSLVLQRPARGHSGDQTAALLQECFPWLRNVSFHTKINTPNDLPKNLAWNSESPRDFDRVMDSIVTSKQSSVYVDYLCGLDLIVDRHYTALQRFFVMDCCSSSEETIAYSTVFHYRNFAREMPRRGKQKGYEEIEAQSMMKLLFPNQNITNIRSPMLIVTPFAPDVQPFVDVLQQQGIDVHVRAASTPVQDFCRLQSATDTMIGLARSTFFLWAALLGNTPHVRAYSIDSEWKRQSKSPVWDHYNWSHPGLERRFHFELYHVS